MKSPEQLSAFCVFLWCNIGIIFRAHSSLKEVSHKSTDAPLSFEILTCVGVNNCDFGGSISDFPRPNADDKVQDIIGAWLLHSRCFRSAPLPLQVGKRFCNCSVLGILHMEEGTPSLMLSDLLWFFFLQDDQ